MNTIKRSCTCCLGCLHPRVRLRCRAIKNSSIVHDANKWVMAVEVVSTLPKEKLAVIGRVATVCNRAAQVTFPADKDVVDTQRCSAAPADCKHNLVPSAIPQVDPKPL